MNIHIVSGYFAAFHNGHKKYLEDALKDCDFLIIIVQSKRFQKKKYGINARSTFDIIKDIDSWWKEQKEGAPIEILINDNENVADLLSKLSKSYKGNNLTFIKDGDRSFDSLPIEEKSALILNKIDFLFLGNPKIESSTKILGVKNESRT